jgi:hypothetical protein
MIGIKIGDRERIAENGRWFLKRDAVLGEITIRFIRVPFTLYWRIINSEHEPGNLIAITPSAMESPASSRQRKRNACLYHKIL